MELTFHTAELREICEKRDVAAAKLGYPAARELADRLADIEAVDTVTDLSQLLGDETICDSGTHEKTLHLKSGLHIVLVSAHTDAMSAPQKAPEWANTTRIKIMAIERSNG